MKERDFSSLPFKTEIITGEEVISDFPKLIRKGNELKEYPVIFGEPKYQSEHHHNTDDPFEILGTMIQNNQESESLISEVNNSDILTWIQKENTELSEYLDDEYNWGNEGLIERNVIAAADLLTQKPKPEILLIKVKAGEPWQINAYIRFGGWNDCPNDEIHLAFAKRWHEKYKAQLVAFSFDTLEFYVEEPPETKEEALALAKEQYIYCNDIVTQGTESIPRLAEGLLNSQYWYFWWD